MFLQQDRPQPTKTAQLWQTGPGPSEYYKSKHYPVLSPALLKIEVGQMHRF